MNLTPTLPQLCGLCACRLKDGRCHRYPPSINHPNKDLSAWPIVGEEARGCFEFRAAHVAEVPQVKEELRKVAERAIQSGDLKRAAEQSAVRAYDGKRIKSR